MITVETQQQETGWESTRTRRPSVCIILPAYNEEAIIEDNVSEVVAYMESLEHLYDWHILIVNDGSSDTTRPLADKLALQHKRVYVTHHVVNMGLCQAMKTGFEQSNADYVVTMDIDLSYSVDHIGRMLDRIISTRAQLVLASPYAEGGSVANVPFGRALMSRVANRFLRMVAPDNISTFTGMVRAYEGRFLKTLDLKSRGMDVNPEVVYKSMILRAKIEEIPARLEWRDAALPSEKGLETSLPPRRSSSMKVPWHTLAILFSGFVFRPFMFFLIPGAIVACLALYASSFVLIHTLTYFQELGQYSYLLNRASHAVEAAYLAHPHTFFVAATATIISIQLLSLGFHSMQNKRYFEELFHLATGIYRNQQH
ncbi:MAG: glycosyltransferase family 2 protein [Verrucomicrobiales bacterium]